MGLVKDGRWLTDEELEVGLKGWFDGWTEVNKQIVVLVTTNNDSALGRIRYYVGCMATGVAGYWSYGRCCPTRQS